MSLTALLDVLPTPTHPVEVVDTGQWKCLNWLLLSSYQMIIKSGFVA
jgi:hypothetical protein